MPETVFITRASLEFAGSTDCTDVLVVCAGLRIADALCALKRLRPELARATTPSPSRTPVMTPKADLADPMVTYRHSPRN